MMSLGCPTCPRQLFRSERGQTPIRTGLASCQWFAYKGDASHWAASVSLTGAAQILCAINRRIASANCANITAYKVGLYPRILTRAKIARRLLRASAASEACREISSSSAASSLLSIFVMASH